MDVLKGRILERVTIKGTLTDTAQINGGLNVPEVIYPPTYQGDYTVTPTEETQTLQTKELYLNDDITVNAIDSDYVGSEIDRRDSTDLTASGATVSVPSGFYEENASKSIPSGTVVPANAITAVGATLTASNNKLSLYRECINAPYVSQAGYIESGTQGKTQITLTADVNTRSSSDLTASGNTVTAPSGYYGSSASKSVQSGSATTPTGGITANPSISVDNNGLITASVNKSESITPIINEGYVTSGTAGTITFSGSATQQMTKRTSSDLTQSGPTVTAPAGYYPSSASKSIPNAENVKGELILREGALESWINEDSGVVAFAGTGTAGWIEADNSGWVGLDQYHEVPDAQIYYDISDTCQLSTQGATTITPTTSEQVAVAKGKFTTGAVKVAAMPTANFYTDFESGFITSNNVRKWRLRGVTVVDPEEEGNAGYIGEGTYEGGWDEFSAVPSGTTITPSTSSQTIGGANYMMEGPVTVSAMPSGTAGTPTATKGAVSNHLVNVTPSVTNTTGYITGGTKTGTAVSVSASELVSGTKSITSNDTGIDVKNYAYVDVAVPSGSPSLQTKSKSYTPTESQQTEAISADTGYDGLDTVNVTVGAISSTYVGTGIDRRDSTNLSASGATVTAPAGYYQSAATKTVSSGTAGTPTATKGTVSNHSVTVTPSVTNSTGYITGSTKTGTAVTVSASELVSGSETKTANGTYDVTNLAELVVNVSGGGTSNFTLLGTKTVGTISTTSTTDTDTGQTIVIGSSAWNNYDLIVCECSVDTQTNGRHTCSTRLAWLTASSNVTTKNGCTFATATWNSKKSSSGTATTRSSTTAYGVYAKAGTISGTNLTLTIYQRYNSTQTGTMNGSYTMRVYGCKIYDLIGG